MTTITTASQVATSVVVVSEKGGQGLPGADGVDGSGFNQVRKSKLDNPLCHLFKTNKLVEASAPTGTDADVTWTRSTTATYVDRYGTVKTAAINTPREEKEGFLIEGASTNLALYSEDFSNAAWALSYATKSASAVIAPDGSTNAYKITAPVNNYRIYTPIVINNVPTTFSFWVKRVSGATSIRIGMGDINDDAVAITDEWTRVCITSQNVGVYPQFGGGAGGAVEFLIWGAQIEELPFASSYIPTTSASVTRTADIVSVPMLNNMPLLHSDFSITGSFRTDNTSGSRIMDTSGLPDRPVIKHNGANKIFAFGTTGSVNVAIITATSGVDFAFTYNSTGSTGRIYANGLSNTATLDFNSALASSPDNIRLASSTVEIFYGHLKDFRLYDFALNADEVEYLS